MEYFLAWVLGLSGLAWTAAIILAVKCGVASAQEAVACEDPYYDPYEEVGYVAAGLGVTVVHLVALVVCMVVDAFQGGNLLKHIWYIALFIPTFVFFFSIQELVYNHHVSKARKLVQFPS